jgi:hypothetical protein
MSTSAMFASDLTDDTEPRRGCDSKRFLACSEAVGHRIQNETGERGDGDTSGKRTRHVVAVSGRFGEIGRPLEYAAARALERRTAPAARIAN